MAEAKTITVPSINLVDESFDIKKSDQYHLSILANEKSFDFSILDTNTNKYLVLRSNIQYPISAAELLKNNFKSVSCSISNNKFTLIPNSLFDEENKKSLMGFNHSINADEKIHSDILRNLEARNLFTISIQLESEMRKQFHNVRFIHNSTSFIEGLLVQNKNNSSKKVFADFHSDHFEIVILDGKKLLFSNAFSYKTPEDIAYYILFVYEQLSLNPETIELVLSGEIERTDKEHSLLYTYIRNVKFASHPDGFNYSYRFEEIPSHKYFSLFTQYLCA